MYKWISIVAIGSNIFSNKKFTEINFRLLLSNSSNLLSRPLFDMASGSVSSMNVISYDFDWMPNILYNDEFDMPQNSISINQLDTYPDIDKRSANENLQISQFNNDLNQYYLLTNEMPAIGRMNEIDYENCDNDDEGKWKDKLRKHRKSSNFGFSSLQKRIERVKNDIINLTNKLNSGYVYENNETVNNDPNTYYNLGFGTMMDNDLLFPGEDPNKVLAETNRDQKTWKCPSQFNASNPYSELSENTQKILNRLHLNEEPPEEIPPDDENVFEDYKDDLEMEEDDIEFTFCTSQTGLLQSYLNKGTLPIIEEEDEYYSSGEDDTDSIRSAIIDNFVMDTETIVTPKSMSSQSIEFTESESYITAFTNPAAANQALTDKTCSSYEDADENFSDYARYSVSSHSSKESLNSNQIENIDNETITDRTLINQESNQDSTYTVKDLKDISSSSMKVDDISDSDAEYDHSTWSNEDILQSIEQSDSLYEKSVKSMIKSSLPNLIESANCCDLTDKSYFLSNKNLNKSTDLDEIMLQVQSPRHQSTKSRLSLSLCNLNSSKSENKICPRTFFQDTVSQSNLMETDLDSGFVSIYQPIKETEILPSVDFSCSMVNINQDKSPVAFNSLVQKLRNKACSIPELRIADSLNKLNVPEWLNFRDDDIKESPSFAEACFRPFQNHTQSLPSNIKVKSPVRQMPSFSKPNKTVIQDPPIKPQLGKPVILPSQKLRQSFQRKLTPINSCKAREILLPKKIAMGVF